MAFVPKEDPEATHSSLKIFLTTILIHPFSRREPGRLLVPRVEKPSQVSLLSTSLLFYFIIFCNLTFHFVKFFKSFTTKAI